MIVSPISSTQSEVFNQISFMPNQPWLVDRACVKHHVKVGYAFPVGDLMYRATDIRTIESSPRLCISKTPVFIPGFSANPGCLGLPSKSTCEIEDVRFDLEFNEGPVSNPEAGGANSCRVVIQPKDPALRSRPDRPLPRSTIVSLRACERVRLNQNLTLVLVRMVSVDDQRQFGGWAEVRLVPTDESQPEK